MNETLKEFEELLKRENLSVTIEYSGESRDKFGPHMVYDVTIDGYAPNLWTYKFTDSAYNYYESCWPTEYDVVACLTMDDPGTIDDFAESYGYDVHVMPISAFINLYEDVCDEWRHVREIFGGILDELKELR